MPCQCEHQAATESLALHFFEQVDCVQFTFIFSITAAFGSTIDETNNLVRWIDGNVVKDFAVEIAKAGVPLSGACFVGEIIQYCVGDNAFVGGTPAIDMDMGYTGCIVDSGWSDQILGHCSLAFHQCYNGAILIYKDSTGNG